MHGVLTQRIIRKFRRNAQVSQFSFKQPVFRRSEAEERMHGTAEAHRFPDQGHEGRAADAAAHREDGRARFRERETVAAGGDGLEHALRHLGEQARAFACDTVHQHGLLIIISGEGKGPLQRLSGDRDVHELAGTEGDGLHKSEPQAVYARGCLIVI